MQNYIKKIADKLFSLLQADEDLSINLHSEDSDFVRFSKSKIRQNTTVSQHEITLVLQAGSRLYKSTHSLTLHFESDYGALSEAISVLRSELALIDENPKISPIENHGVSTVLKKCERPPHDQILNSITNQFATSDMAGIYCSGPLRQASLNSKGQFHYFEIDQFFLDYSIYDGPKAAKGFYAEPQWNEESFRKQTSHIKNTLSLLNKPTIQLKPGSYRTYLEPMAVAEIISIFNWRALSQAAYEQGFAPLKKLKQKELLLSDKFSLIENNDLGLNSHFNNAGELSPLNLPLIENGELRTLLICSATAKEYGLKSNYAETGHWSTETMRSAEVRAGTLKEQDILKKLNTGLYLSNLHYINWSDPQSARITGMTRFACFWVENGEIVGPIQDLRFDDSLYNLFGNSVEEITEETSVFTNTATYQKRYLGGMKIPGFLLNTMNFTL